MSEFTPKSVGDVYTEHHKTGERLGKSFLEETRAPLFKQWIGEGKSILDLGGRDGTLTRHYLPGNQVVIGDIDVDAMITARDTYGVEIIEVDLNTALPFEDNSYDVIVLAEVLEHLPYPRVTFSEIRRVLKPNGILVGSIPLAYHLTDRWRVLRGKKLWANYDFTHVRFFKYDELIAFCGEYFEVEEVVSVRGGKKADWFPRLFARDVAFRCRKAG